VARIHQVLSGAGPVDAVTTQAFEYRRAFSDWGMAGGIYASAIEPAVRSEVHALSKLAPEPDDLLLFHYSAYAPRLEPLLEAPQRKLLVYHNVTPAEWLWEHQPHVATLCALGRDHLPRWAQAVDVAAAVSEFNAAELREAGASETRVIPILFDPTRVREPVAAGAPGAGTRVVYVGRVTPHKRPELVLRAFSLYRDACDPTARLDVVGEDLSPVYGELVRSEAGPGVTFHGRLSQPQLNMLWREADVFLTLSEHEGFCVPLLEAFATDTPVIARPVGGMPEVGGDAVLWIADRDLAVVAELIDLAVRDAGLRSELVARGHARLEAFSRDRVLADLRRAVDTALG
jgi:glycosyltransferase involved in cell wall biosynthesis